MALLKLYLHIFDLQEILIPHLQSRCKFIKKILSIFCDNFWWYYPSGMKKKAYKLINRCHINYLYSEQYCGFRWILKTIHRRIHEHLNSSHEYIRYNVVPIYYICMICHPVNFEGKCIPLWILTLCSIFKKEPPQTWYNGKASNNH